MSLKAQCVIDTDSIAARSSVVPKPHVVLFGDTYVKKHYECVLPIINELISNGIIPVLTNERWLPSGIDCDCIVYFNKPVNQPIPEYADKPRIILDHGASNLKWFLANTSRYNFADVILTAGPDHTRSLLTFFDAGEVSQTKVRDSGFVKSNALLSPPRMTRADVAKRCSLDPEKKIILFAPTWHISNNRDMVIAIHEIAKLENHVATIHPETVHLDTSGLNIIANDDGITTELLKHADCVISDTSSTLFEAAALDKPIVQLGLREYSDNSALLFDFPYTAGSSDLFCSGRFSRPARVGDAVRQVLDDDEHTKQALQLLRQRVMDGTYIKTDSGRDISKQIKKVCLEQTRLRASEDDDHFASVNLDRVHAKLFLAKNRIIAHGGGNFGPHHASNSREAVGAALASCNIVELDFVMASDGVIVAHNGFEPRYGIDKPFSEITCEEFLDHRYAGELSPLTIEDAIIACARAGKALVCDIKDTKDAYRDVASRIHEVAKRHNVLDRVIVQCYSVEDFKTAIALGFEHMLLAVWKYFYKDPVGDDSFAFLQKCLVMSPDKVVAVSIPYINHHMKCPSYKDSRFMRFFALWRRLYIHGAPVPEYTAILQNNLGIFADCWEPELQFRDSPKDFDWKEYLFLNSRLVDAGCDNEVAATVHFMKYGRHEGRKIKFDVPNDFDYARYLDLNPGLRKAGIGGVNSAHAHWTAYGSSEGRKYK